MTENHELNSSVDGNDEAFREQIELEVTQPHSTIPFTIELKALFLNEADDLESHAIRAFEDGKISQDEYHQLSLLAMMYLHGEIEQPEFGQNEALAFALGLSRACGLLIKHAVEDGDINYCFSLLSLGNVSLGVAKRIEIEQELRKEKAKKAAKTRHAQNDVYKQLVWDYYRQDIKNFKSLDQAAEKISSKSNIPFAFRTVRKWIDEFHKTQKKLPSA